jgi:uncharacterized protein
VGPSNIALVQFFKADQAYLAAVSELDQATKSVRIQQAKVNQLTAEIEQAHKKSIELEAKAREADLDVKARDQRIETLRERQQNATNDKEYKTLIVDINTQKADQKKAEESALAAMDASEKQKVAHAELKTRLEGESAKLKQLTGAIDEQVAQLKAKVEELKGPRDELAKSISPKAMILYERAASRQDGESMAPMSKPKAKVEEYICTGCNMDLVADIYNRLHTRDEPVVCPNCGRLLYIPEDLPPEVAVNKAKVKSSTDKPKKPRKPKVPKVDGAAAPAAPTATAAAAVLATPTDAAVESTEATDTSSVDTSASSDSAEVVESSSSNE